MEMLRGEDLLGGYGRHAENDILRGCSVAAAAGKINVIVGPNGAGKSTAMKALFGMFGLRGGRVLLNGEDITALAPEMRVGKGMGFVPQTANVFPGMTVEENLEMGAFTCPEKTADGISHVYGLFPALAAKSGQQAGELSGGQRQQVAVGRALMTRPQVLMLDEPTAGVSPAVVDDLFNRIISIAQTGVAVLMVEQNARAALEIADTGFILARGKNRYTDSGAALLADREVRKAFLGG